ncbi:hypothetical protein CCMA1212_006470 [Trichoderma ghanense]|uniref:Uncharacterized protein n=1 Tax=Trichoderma ghanense TaxID=65468 RepID=A0ABY2H2L7_9HYPO
MLSWTKASSRVETRIGDDLTWRNWGRYQGEAPWVHLRTDFFTPGPALTAYQADQRGGTWAAQPQRLSSRHRQSVGSPGPAMRKTASKDEPKTAGDTQASPLEASDLVPAALTDDLDMLWDSFQPQYNPFELSFFNPEFPMSLSTLDVAPLLSVPSTESTTPNSDISSRTEDSIWQDDLPCASALMNPRPLQGPKIPRVWRVGACGMRRGS